LDYKKSEYDYILYFIFEKLIKSFYNNIFVIIQYTNIIILNHDIDPENIDNQDNNIEDTKEYCYCGKNYKHKQNLYRHHKNCNIYKKLKKLINHSDKNKIREFNNVVKNNSLFKLYDVINT
jgi:hypothetical protein